MGDVRFVFEGIQECLEEQIGKEGFTVSDVAASISQKIEEYWGIMDRSSIASAILDPRTKLSIFSEEDKQSACEHIQEIFETYREYYSNIQSQSSGKSSSTTNTGRQFFISRRNPTIQFASTYLVSELDRYLALPAEESDPLLWWRVHEMEYPVVSKMARDYLSIQATSVPSEQAFSVAGNTISKTRNCLLPETARACLCMKSWITNNIGN